MRTYLHLACLTCLTALGWLAGPQRAEAQRFGISLNTPGGVRIDYGNYPRGSYYDRYQGGYYGGSYNDRYRDYYGRPYPSSGIYVEPNRYAYPRPDYYYGEPAPAYQAAPAAAATGTFNLEVRVPTEDAKVLFNGVDSGKEGRIREFETTDMAVGRSYTFEAEVHWTENGKEIIERRQIQARAGESLRIDFQARAK